MRLPICGIVVAALAMLAQPAVADDFDTCDKASGDVAIAACTRAIGSGKYTARKLAELYNDRGGAYANKGDLDRAIADFTQAIHLDPTDALNYNNRGACWSSKGDYDRAIADFDQAIRLDPKDANTYLGRGDSWNAKGDYTRAIADFDLAISLDPKLTDAYLDRGYANLYSGALPRALADLKQASELNPKHAYAAVFLDIVNKRSNLPSRLAEASKQIDMTKWPAPIIRLYLGQVTSEAALAAADDPDAETRASHTCDANFFSGELMLRRGAKDEATRLFRLASASCHPSRVMQWGAKAELKALGASP